MILEGGIVAYIIKGNKGLFYYSENSTWSLNDWKKEIDDESYFEYINKFELDFSVYSLEVLRNNLPQLLIDFDKKKLVNNYYDQALEDRVPELWKGTWLENTNDFLNLIPEEKKYWKEFNKNT